MFNLLPHLTSASALPGNSKSSKIHFEINEITSKNSIYPNPWSPTAGQLQSLAVLQQCVYQMKFKNVYKFKKQL